MSSAMKAEDPIEDSLRLEEVEQAALGSSSLLEIWRSGRRLSLGASYELRKSLELINNNGGQGDFSVTLGRRASSMQSKNGPKLTYISCLITDTKWALDALKAPASMVQLENMAIFIHESQSGSSRGYHSVGRVFEVSSGATPIQRLAAFFRDTIHQSIDKQLTDRQKKHLGQVFLPDSFVLNPAIFEDEVVSAVAAVFDCHPNENMQKKYKWRNSADVFLSALVAASFLRDILSLSQMIQVAACLEGTIPFRENDERGSTPIDLLHERLVRINQKLSLSMSETDFIQCCQQAVDLHNRMVGNFSSSDPAYFLNHTWSLLPEEHISLRQHHVYSLTDFYNAVSNMRDFMISIGDHPMFNSFHGIPAEAESKKLRENFQKNHRIGVVYLSAVTLGIGIVVAFATLTGNANVAKSLFFGDLNSHKDEDTHDALGAELPTLSTLHGECTNQVYTLLCKGRTEESTFDHRNVPVAAFVYGILGNDQLAAVMKHCVKPMTKESSEALLRSLPIQLVESIGYELARIAISRAGAIEQVLNSMRTGAD